MRQASKVTEQQNADAPTWTRSGTRRHKREERSTASLFVGWQVIKATKLKTPPFQVTSHVAILLKALREKNSFNMESV